MTEHESQISEIISAWEDANGVELDDEQFDELGHAIAEQAEEHGSYDIDQLLKHHGIAEPYDENYDDEDDEAAEQDAFVEDVQREYAKLENKLGRKLTQREVDGVSAGLAEQDQRYRDLDAHAALTDYYDQGGKKLDVETRQGRQAWMAERMSDERAATAPDTSDRTYDLDDRGDRLAYMGERMNGTEFVESPADETSE